MLRTKLSDLVRERIKQKKELETKIREQKKEITEKDDRNAQLHKLFQGTAKIFSKQHNFVDQLKQQLEQEIKEKGISEEKAKHLAKDCEVYVK
jgi:nucleoid-associated protein YejK